VVARKRRKLVLIGLAAVPLALLSACSSGSSSGGGSGASSTSAGGGSATAASSSAAGEGTSSVAQFLQRPTSIPLNTPVGKPIPTKKTIEYIECGLPTCEQEGQYVQTIATRELGWQVGLLTTDGSPQQIQNAWVQALRANPAAILYTGTPTSEIQQYIQQAAARHIFADAGLTNDPDGAPASGPGIGFNMGSNADYYTPAWSALIASDSGGHGNAVFVGLPAYPILVAEDAALKTDLAKDCPACTLSTLNISLSQLGPNEPSLIVSYLRSHPQIKYVVLSVQNALGEGLPAALKSAGLNGLVITGAAPDATILQYIANGEFNSTVWFPLAEDMYGMVDAAARAIAGVPVQPPYKVPVWLVNKDNLPGTNTQIPIVASIADHFAHLWHTS
jgi:ribose transport system substrate-binding protein